MGPPNWLATSSGFSDQFFRNHQHIQLTVISTLIINMTSPAVAPYDKWPVERYLWRKVLNLLISNTLIYTSKCWLGSLLIFLIRKVKDMGLCFNLATSYSQLVRIYIYDPFKTAECCSLKNSLCNVLKWSRKWAPQISSSNHTLFIAISYSLAQQLLTHRRHTHDIERAGLLSTGA